MLHEHHTSLPQTHSLNLSTSLASSYGGTGSGLGALGSGYGSGGNGLTGSGSRLTMLGSGMSGLGGSGLSLAGLSTGSPVLPCSSSLGPESGLAASCLGSQGSSVGSGSSCGSASSQGLLDLTLTRAEVSSMTMTGKSRR